MGLSVGLSGRFAHALVQFLHHPRGMGVPPMKHGQDARATFAQQGGGDASNPGITVGRIELIEIIEIIESVESLDSLDSFEARPSSRSLPMRFEARGLRGALERA